MKSVRFALLLTALVLSSLASSSAQVNGFSLVKPAGVPGAMLTLPGATRRLFLNCASGCSTTDAASWAVTASSGGASAAIVPSSTGNFADVTLGATAGSCPVTGPSGASTITASASVTVTATAANDPTKSDFVVLDVCSPAVEAYTIPFYRVLYAGQREDIQGMIWGSTNTDGTWQMISEPAGGDAVLDDVRFRDTVFHATVPGLYKVRWTSAADGAKSAYSTFYVTGNAQPRPAQPNGTEPIDCTVDPNTTGGVLEVGPSQTFKNLEAIAQSALVPGVTVRLHNEDTSGFNPTTYHEWVQLSTAGTHDNPIRLCGVPDSRGNLPVMDGTNATARGDVLNPTIVSGLAGIFVYAKNFDLYPAYSGPQFVIVEGIALRNYGPPHAFSPAGASGGSTPYQKGSSGFRFQDCRDCELNGSEVSSNGNGVFNEANDSNAWGGISERLLFEGNNVHDNGVTGDTHEHNLYLQGWFQVVQFNQIPTYNTAAQGSQFKDRGMSWFRYNLVGTGALRMLDFVEDQDGPHYLDPHLYLTNFRGSYAKDGYTGDQLAAAQEAWHHSEYVYGNIFEQTTSDSVHFSADNLGGSSMRVGALEFYNNTINSVGYTGWRYYWFDTGDHGSNMLHYEWPTINVSNTVVSGAVDSKTPYFSWGAQRDAFMNFNSVLVSSQWGTNAQNCVDNSKGLCDGSGWPYQSNTDVYFNGNQFNATGVGTFVSAGVINFLDPVTYQTTNPVAGSPLAGPQAQLPVRFEYIAKGGYAIPRSTVVNDTTGGTIGAMDSQSTPPVIAPAVPVGIALTPGSLSLAPLGQAVLGCTTTLSDGSTRACLAPSASSSNVLLATVSGLTVTAGANNGTGTINVSAEGMQAAASLTVAASVPAAPKPKPTVTVVKISIVPATLQLAAQGKATLTCLATLSDASTRACNNPILMSSNTALASVTGLVVSAHETGGSGSITALAEGLSAQLAFSVTSTPATVSIQLTPTLNTLNVGKSTSVYCTAKQSNGVKRACLAPVVTISNGALAVLSGAKITARASGKATLTVVAEGQSAVATLVVN